MTIQVFDTAVELPVGRSAVWELLVDPQLYPRMFTGIGTCERVETIAGTPVWRLRIGAAGTEIRTISLTMRIVRPGHDADLSCPVTGSFAAVRLHDAEGGTRVAITCFADGSLHSVVDTASTGAASTATTSIGAVSIGVSRAVRSPGAQPGTDVSARRARSRQ